MSIVNQPSTPAPATITPEIMEQAGSEKEIPATTVESTTDRTVKGPVVLLVNNAHVSLEYNVGKSGRHGRHLCTDGSEKDPARSPGKRDNGFHWLVSAVS